MIKKNTLLPAILLFVAALLNPSLAAAQGLTIGNGATFSVNDGILNVPFDVVIRGTLDVGSGAVRVGGDWNVSGTFTPGTGTVQFIDGKSPSVISGDNQFYTLSATTLTGKHLSFEGAKTQTVAHALNLQGAAGNLLVLRSSAQDRQAIIGLQAEGTQTIAYVDVRDHRAPGQHLASGPAAGFNSVDSGNNNAWFLNALNTPPVANSDTAETNEDTATAINLAGNDTDADGTIDPATVAIVAGPGKGTVVSINSDGTVVYRPQADYNGPDTFIYTVNDNQGATSNQAAVNITVAAVNDKPQLGIVSGVIHGYAMPGRVFTLGLQGSDRETGCAGLVFSLISGSNPQTMTIVRNECGAKIRWTPTGSDKGLTLEGIQTIVSDSETLPSDPVSFSITVLEPLKIAPDTVVLVRTITKEDGQAIDTADATRDLIITGGKPHSSRRYYTYLLINAETDQTIDTGTDKIYEDTETEGLFRYHIATANLPVGTYRLKVTDGEGFTEISGLIKIREATVETVAMDSTDPVDPSAGDTRTVQSGAYVGATIKIESESGASSESVTMTFKMVTAGQPYVPPAVPVGNIIEIKAKEPNGDDATFTKPIEVTIPYGGIGNITESAREGDLRIYRFDTDKDRWVPVDSYTVDTASKTITFRVTRFSQFMPAVPEEFTKTLTGGIHTENYRMISFPGNPDNPDLKENLATTLGAYDDTIWRSFAFDRSTGDYDEADLADFSDKHKLKPGRSYWIISRNDASCKVKGLSINTAKSFEGKLHPGWNMVANPYNTPVDLNNYSIKVSADGATFENITTTALTDNHLFKFDPHDDGQGNITWYSKVSPDPGSEEPPYEKMQPYEGYWFYSKHTADLIIRFEPKQNGTVQGNNRPPVYKRMLRLARRSLHWLTEAAAAICFAGNGGGAQPPPPPGSPGASGSPDTIGVATASGGGCFIATASYGSSIHPHVKILRSFRDTYLLTNNPGKRFVELYYRSSPAIAKKISRHATLKYLSRIVIISLVGFSVLVLYTGALVKLLSLSVTMFGIGLLIWRRQKRPNKWYMIN